MTFEEWISKNEKEIFFTYTNANNEVSNNYVVDAVYKDNYLQGYCINKKGFRTFKLERILDVYSSNEEMVSAASPLTIVDLKIENRRVKDTPRGLEICFTGFDKDIKDELESLAEKKGLLVRKGITAKLYFLCCGPNAGWKKIKQANEKNCFILSKDQFSSFVDTGEIPIEPTEVYDSDEKDIHEKIEILHNEITSTFRTIREPRRSTALIARFVDGYAIGWRFAIRESHRNALDIKLTKFVFNKHQYEDWTQGSSFSFGRGDVFYSDKLGYSEWSEFLKIPDAVVLQVKYECFSGYDPVATIDGFFSGDFIPDNQLTPKKLTNLPIMIRSESYDPGKITLDIFKPSLDRSNLDLFDTIKITQDELISLLQSGYYWKKDEGQKPVRINLFGDN